MDDVTIYHNEFGEPVKRSFSRKAVIVSHDRVLLTKNEHSGEWTIPGGRRHINEHWRHTLVREIAEELSLDRRHITMYQKLHQERKIFRSPNNGKLVDIIFTYYLCKPRTNLQPKMYTGSWHKITDVLPKLKDHEQLALKSYLSSLEMV